MLKVEVVSMPAFILMPLLLLMLLVVRSVLKLEVVG